MEFLDGCAWRLLGKACHDYDNGKTVHASRDGGSDLVIFRGKKLSLKQWDTTSSRNVSPALGSVGGKAIMTTEHLPFALLRTPLSAEQLKLQVGAMRWLLDLPAEARPLKLSRQFPRIVNQLAQLWPTERPCRRYLHGLMLDERGGRQGFAVEVVFELGNLLNHYDQLHPERPSGAWEWSDDSLMP